MTALRERRPVSQAEAAAGSAATMIGAPLQAGMEQLSEGSRHAEIAVVVAKLSMVEDDDGFVKRLTDVINAAYGTYRVDEYEMQERIAASDSGRNRVLHLAFRGDVLVGCCSSTLQPPWTCWGVGHWGLLAVDPAAQGGGVASALVAAAEDRLRQAGCGAVQIEYKYRAGDAAKERLFQWYEQKLGYACWSGAPSQSPGQRQFRICHKRLGAGSSCLPAYCCHCGSSCTIA
eukprot:TRINITY_DN101631_c0_g1_i1.p1 TRINITY_DN101631_c0_g1~~TRINITY_DN101631_c0_g1_i1.p1  ORF type:complete len:231 (+),score=52.30 TRINITY_DN101631_c0_g1_i1:52-744(+)